MPIPDSEDCLYDLGCECENLFNELQGFPAKIRPELCSEFQQRFSIWAANLGVFARKSQCLDTRLRNWPDLQDLVRRLLDILRRSLQEYKVATRDRNEGDTVTIGFEKSQPELNDTQWAALRAIDDTLTRLNRLGVTIRKSSRGRIDTKVLKFATSLNLEPFEYLCANVVQSLYPDAHQSLKGYLASSMTKRYAEMLFLKSRQVKLKTRREPYLGMPPVPEVPEDESQGDVPAAWPAKIIDSSVITKVSKTTGTSRSDLSTLDEQKIRGRRQPPDEASTKNYKTSSIQVYQGNYPGPPLTNENSNIRTCPWCAALLSKELSKNEWCEHVDKEFKPYTCLAEECEEAYPAYPTFDDWFKHMKDHHKRWHQRFYVTSNWLCTICKDNLDVYRSPQALYLHMQGLHADFTDEQLQVVSRQSRMEYSRAWNDCLLCCFTVEERENKSRAIFPGGLRGNRKQENTKSTGKNPDMANRRARNIETEPSDTSSDSDSAESRHRRPQQIEERLRVVARHVAAHLQTLMILTLRLAEAYNYKEDLVDDTKSDAVEIDQGNSASEGEDIGHLSDVTFKGDIARDIPEGDIDDEESIYMDVVEDDILVPDADIDLSYVPRQYDNLIREQDTYLEALVQSGAFQAKPPEHLKFIAPKTRRRARQSSTVGHFMVPLKRNPNFVGRGNVLVKLLQMVSPSTSGYRYPSTVINGCGGSGKTQIALEVAYHIGEKFPDCSIFWVPAATPTSFECAYREMSRLLGLDTKGKSAEDVMMLVKTTLSADPTRNWLLIIDGIDNIDIPGFEKLNNHLPTSWRGSIIFTTRNYGAVRRLSIMPSECLSIEKMENTAATHLLRTGLNERQTSDLQGTDRLLKFLCNLPIAVKQASAYMASNPDVTIPQYFELCKLSNPGPGLDPPGSRRESGTPDCDNQQAGSQHFSVHENDREIPIITPWLVSFNHISSLHPQAAQCLKFICLLCEKDVPLHILPGTSISQAAEAIKILESYAFIIKRNTLDSVDVHHLVQSMTRDWLREHGEWEEWTTQVVKRLEEQYPLPQDDNIGSWIKYLPHGEAVLGFSAADSTIAMRVATSYFILGKYRAAELLYRGALAHKEEVSGLDHPDTLNMMGQLAEALARQSMSDGAERLYWQILEQQEKLLGRNHPETIRTKDELVQVLSMQGKYDTANDLEAILASSSYGT
ncbi:hypothetical protein F5X98DRAFT_385348 [Xylaria grammica]|nr:hypothetical protein F5X98DRAFT_385348 [Xylaria grammica]